MTNDIELIPLAVTRSDNDITLRIDRNGSGQSQIACRDAARVFAVLTEFINNPIYYEVVKEHRGAVSFQVDYLSGKVRVDCTQVDETWTDYTFEELRQKTIRLARLYAASAQSPFWGLSRQERKERLDEGLFSELCDFARKKSLFAVESLLQIQ
jgi:hypothetical protein